MQIVSPTQEKHLCKLGANLERVGALYDYVNQ